MTSVFLVTFPTYTTLIFPDGHCCSMYVFSRFLTQQRRMNLSLLILVFCKFSTYFCVKYMGKFRHKHMRKLKQYVILFHKQLLQSSYFYTKIDNRNYKYNHCPSSIIHICKVFEFIGIKKLKAQHASMQVRGGEGDSIVSSCLFVTDSSLPV